MKFKTYNVSLYFEDELVTQITSLFLLSKSVQADISSMYRIIICEVEKNRNLCFFESAPSLLLLLKQEPKDYDITELQIFAEWNS